MRALLTSALVFAVLVVSVPTEAFDIKGGPVWKKRLGWGMAAGVGSLYCGEEICDDNNLWDTEFWGSIEGSIGGFYRFIPNLSFFFDLRTAYVNTSPSNKHDDRGFLFEMAAGLDFHIPALDWLDIWFGAGTGFSHLRFKGERDDRNNRTDNDDVRQSFNGILFEARTGADVYLFTRAPNLGLGVYMRWGFPLWLGMCYENGELDECVERDEIDEFDGFDDNDLPWLYHLGVRLIYGF